MKKNELMTGDIVVMRSGLLAVVIRNEKENYLLFQTGGWESLDDYNDDMVCEYDPDSDAGMHVYRVPSGGISFSDYEDEEPIYERDYTWTKPTEEEIVAATEAARIEREAKEAELRTQAEETRKNNISIISQFYYGNRTGTEVNRDRIDYFLRGYQGNYHPDDIEDVARKTVLVPGTDNIVIVYDQTQEDRYVNVDFPERYAQDGAKYLERWGEELKMHISCEIPELGFKIHTRCFACRMDKNGVFQSLEDADIEKFIHYFPVK